MRERFQRQFRSDKNKKKNKKRRRTRRKSDTTTTDSGDDEDDDDGSEAFSSLSKTFPRRRRSDDDYEPPGSSGGSGRSGASGRRTPTGRRPPSRSGSSAKSRLSKKGGGRDAAETSDDISVNFVIALRIHNGDQTSEDELPLMFCRGLTFHETENKEAGSGAESDGVQPEDSVSQQASNCSENSDNEAAALRPPATSDETDTDLLTEDDWLESARRRSQCAAQRICLDDPRRCGPPMTPPAALETPDCGVVDRDVVASAAGGGGDTPMKKKSTDVGEPDKADEHPVA